MTDQGKTRRHAYSAVLLQTPTFIFFTHLSELIQGEADSLKTLKAAFNIQQQRRDWRRTVRVMKVFRVS